MDARLPENLISSSSENLWISAQSYALGNPIATDGISALGNLSWQGSRDWRIQSKGFLEAGLEVSKVRQAFEGKLVFGQTPHLSYELLQLLRILEEQVRQPTHKRCRSL